jgi:hypothetical protein
MDVIKKHGENFHFVATNQQSWLFNIKLQRHKMKKIAKSKQQMDWGGI